jgi:hypothetical protein
MTSAALPSDGSGTLRCARHPNTETVLRCGRCETPICPRCLVPTPVGARCPTCAHVKRFSSLLKPAELARAIGFGLLVSALGTVVILRFLPVLGLLGYAAIGFGVGEAVSVGAHRKRVRELAPIAVACLFLGFCVGVVGLLLNTGLPLSLGVLVTPISILFGGSLLQGPLVGLLIGALLAWMRTR